MCVYPDTVGTVSVHSRQRSEGLLNRSADLLFAFARPGTRIADLASTGGSSDWATLLDAAELIVKFTIHRK